MRRRGFTLLEVVAAMAILAVALSALVIERNNAVRRTARTNQRRVALQLAKTKIAEIVAGVESGSGGGFDDHAGYAWSASENAEEAVRQGEASLMRRIAVSVEFDAPGGPDRVNLEVSVRR